jgi:hypothetical protein
MICSKQGNCVWNNVSCLEEAVANFYVLTTTQKLLEIAKPYNDLEFAELCGINSLWTFSSYMFQQLHIRVL